MSVARLLKEETHLEHQEAESVLRPQLEKLHTQTQYCKLLRRFYGFYSPVQERALQLVSPHTLPDRSSRNTSELILKDLQSLGCSIEKIPLSADLPQLKTEAQAMGALYVIEGSGLGGKLIRKMLLSNSTLNIKEGSVLFFNGYGDQTGAKWLSFLQGLDSQNDRNAVLNSARQSFQIFTKWIAGAL